MNIIEENLEDGKRFWSMVMNFCKTKVIKWVLVFLIPALVFNFIVIFYEIVIKENISQHRFIDVSKENFIPYLITFLLTILVIVSLGVKRGLKASLYTSLKYIFEFLRIGMTLFISLVAFTYLYDQPIDWFALVTLVLMGFTVYYLIEIAEDFLYRKFKFSKTINKI